MELFCTEFIKTFFKCFNKFLYLNRKCLNNLKVKAFEQLSIFNWFIIIYRETQKVKKNFDLIEMKKLA